MKKFVFINLRSLCVISTIILFVISSCSRKENMYSCDPTVENWVKDHIEDIQNMNREEWRNADMSLKRPMYIAFTPNQKQKFWIEKIEEIKELNIWSDKEIDHINLLENFVIENKRYFDINNRSEDDLKQINTFSIEWYDYAKNELHWTDKLIYSIVISGDKLLDKEGNVEEKENFKMVKNDSETSVCDCNMNFSLCGITQWSCQNDGCVVEGSGCGLLLLQKCNGTCMP